MKNLLSAMQDLGNIQSKMDEIRKKVDRLEASGKAGGNMVEIVMQGNGNVTDIKIKPDLLKEDNADILKDLLIAAFNNANEAIAEKKNEETKNLFGGLPLPKDFKFPF